MHSMRLFSKQFSLNLICQKKHILLRDDFAKIPLSGLMEYWHHGCGCHGG